MDAILNNIAHWLERAESEIAAAEKFIATAATITERPFARQEDLAAAETRLAALEQELTDNPTPSPSWLRNGAPVGTPIWWHGERLTVMGHRGEEAILVDHNGVMEAVPVGEAKAEDGLPVFPDRASDAGGAPLPLAARNAARNKTGSRRKPSQRTGWVEEEWRLFTDTYAESGKEAATYTTLGHERVTHGRDAYEVHQVRVTEPGERTRTEWWVFSGTIDEVLTYRHDKLGFLFLAEDYPTREEATAHVREAIQDADTQALGSGGAMGHASRPNMPVASPGSATQERIGARAVIEDLEKLFGFPIRAGRLSRKYRGVFKPRAGVARLGREESASIDAATHEVAHGVDAMGEIIKAAPAAARNDVARIDYDPTAARPKEGFAEFIRGYLTEDFDAATEAPVFAAWFSTWLGSHPTYERRLVSAKALIGRWRNTSALGRVQGQIHQDPTLREQVVALPETVKENLPDWLHRAYQAIKDQFHFGHQFERHLRARGYKPNPGESFMDLARAFTQGGPTLANTALESGVFTLGSNMERLSGSLWEALRPIRDQDYDTWVAWAYARHAIESWRLGKNPGVTLDDAKEVYAQFRNRPGWETAAKAVTDFNDALVAMLAQAGVITTGSAKKIIRAYQTYLPLHRVVPDQVAREMTGGGRLVDLPSPLKRRVGSGYQIVDPIQATVQRAVMFYERAAAQVVQNEMVRAAQRHGGVTEYGTNGWIERLPPNLVKTDATLDEVWPAVQKALRKSGLTAAEVADIESDLDNATNGDWREDIVAIWRPDYWDHSGQPVARLLVNGKPALYQFNADLYQTVSGMAYWRMPKLLDATFGRLTRMVRVGSTTLSPGFTLRNFLRDLPTYLIQRNYGGAADPLAWVGSYAMSEFQRRRGKEEDPFVKLWRQHGGQLSSVLGQDRASVRRAVESSVRGRQKFGVMESVLDAMQVTEAGPRLAEFAGVFRKHGYTRDQVATMVRTGKIPRDVLVEALNAAHEVTIDFRRMGTAGRWFTRLIPFWNAQVEGLDKAIRTWRDAPGRTLARYVGVVIVPAIVYWWIHKDEDWYQKRKRWTNLYWVFTDGEGKPILRLPRGHELGQVSAGVEAILDALYRENPKAIQEWGAGIFETTGPEVTPWAVSGLGPWLEATANWDTFREQPIVPRSLQDAPPELQYTRQNTALMRAVGSWLRVSPAKLEHVVDETTGGVYGRGETMAESWLGVQDGDRWGGVVEGFSFRSDPVGMLDEFYADAEQANDAYLRAKAKGGRVPPQVASDRYAAEKTRSLLSDLRQLANDATDRDARFAAERYSQGLAIWATGDDPADRYPSPFGSDVRGRVRQAVDAHLAATAYAVAGSEQLQPEDARAAAYLRQTGVPVARLNAILGQKLRAMGRSRESISVWTDRLSRRMH